MDIWLWADGSPAIGPLLVLMSAALCMSCADESDIRCRRDAALARNVEDDDLAFHVALIAALQA